MTILFFDWQREKPENKKRSEERKKERKKESKKERKKEKLTVAETRHQKK